MEKTEGIPQDGYWINNNEGIYKYVPTTKHSTNVSDSFPTLENIDKSLKSPNKKNTLEIVGKVALEKCSHFLEVADKIVTWVSKKLLKILGIITILAAIVVNTALCIPELVVGKIAKLVVGLSEKALEKLGLIKEKDMSRADRAEFYSGNIIIIPVHILVNIANIFFYLADKKHLIKPDNTFLIDLAKLEERIKNFTQNQKNSSQEI